MGIYKAAKSVLVCAMVRIIIPETDMEQAIEQAGEAIKRGGIVAYPTETFYGLGVKFDREDLLKKLYDIKRRPKERAMPLIIGERELLSLIVMSINPQALLLMERFWPGPLTLVFPAKENISHYITAGTGKVAIRIPGESFALHLAKRVNFPITATSANLSGMPPARDGRAVIKYFGDTVDLLIDGGPVPGRLPSTIVDVTGDEIEILREGAINSVVLREFLKKRSLRNI